MKILYFDDFKLGVLKGDAVVDVSAVVKDIPHTGPHNLISGLIERFADYRYAQSTLVPFRTILMEDGKQTQETRILTVTFGVKVDDALFKNPSA